MFNGIDTLVIIERISSFISFDSFFSFLSSKKREKERDRQRKRERAQRKEHLYINAHAHISSNQREKSKNYFFVFISILKLESIKSISMISKMNENHRRFSLWDIVCYKPLYIILPNVFILRPLRYLLHYYIKPAKFLVIVLPRSIWQKGKDRIVHKLATVG